MVNQVWIREKSHYIRLGDLCRHGVRHFRTVSLKLLMVILEYKISSNNSQDVFLFPKVLKSTIVYKNMSVEFAYSVLAINS